MHREFITALAVRHRLPAVYAHRFFSAGLISYGPDTIDQFRRAAGYVARILEGEKPADLPVQAWQRALRRSRQYRASAGRKPIRHVRCA